MTFTKRQATMSIKHKVEYLDNAKQTFFDTIKQMKDFKIPDNRDQTGLNMVFHCFWTIQHKGAKQVNVAGLGIKRQITALFCSDTHAHCFNLSANLPWFDDHVAH